MPRVSRAKSDLMPFASMQTAFFLLAVEQGAGGRVAKCGYPVAAAVHADVAKVT